MWRNKPLLCEFVRDLFVDLLIGQTLPLELLVSKPNELVQLQLKAVQHLSDDALGDSIRETEDFPDSNLRTLRGSGHGAKTGTLSGASHGVCPISGKSAQDVGVSAPPGCPKRDGLRARGGANPKGPAQKGRT